MIYLGVDCGTQSTKTIALDGDTGEIIASAVQAYGLIPGLPAGHMEQDPLLWIEALESTVGEVLAALGNRRSEVKGIGISGQQHGFVPLDEKGGVIRAAKLWCDTSTEAECDLFRAEFGGTKGLIDLIGLDMLPGFTAPKILWLKRHEPENFARLATVLLPHDYLNYFLTGKFTMEYGDASGSALMNVRSRSWSQEIVSFIDPALAGKLPALQASDKAAGTLLPVLGKKWNLSPDVVVSAGGGDNMMGAIGTANVRAGRVTASLGTSGTIYAYGDKPIIDPAGEIAGFCDSTNGWLPLVCTMNVTVATEAARSLFGWSHAQVDGAVRTISAGSDGLMFLPYLQGERTPNLPRGTGSFHGLTTQNMTPAHLLRATMEGVTLGLGYGLDRLRTLGIQPSEIRLIGGGSKSAFWRQLCADVFGCRVATLVQSEGAALGAAIQALGAAQTEKSVADWSDAIVKVDEDEAAEPQSAPAFDYAEALQRQTALMRTLYPA